MLGLLMDIPSFCFSNRIKEMPLIANKQWKYIPIPIPIAALIPPDLPFIDDSRMTINVSGPGLVKATK